MVMAGTKARVGLKHDKLHMLAVDKLCVHVRNVNMLAHKASSMH